MTHKQRFTESVDTACILTLQTLVTHAELLSRFTIGRLTSLAK